jgi:hypothetical protein
MRYFQRLMFASMLLALFVGLPGHVNGLQVSVQAQDPHHPDQGFAPDAAATPEQHQRMMSQHMMRMMSEMKTADTKLDALVQTMNAAKGAEKTDAIAAVVTALIGERRSMHSSMTTMMNMMSSGSGSKAERDHSKP